MAVNLIATYTPAYPKPDDVPRPVPSEISNEAVDACQFSIHDDIQKIVDHGKLEVLKCTIDEYVVDADKDRNHLRNP